MKAKCLEIRDSATFIPVLAVNINPDNDAQRYLMRRVGYPCDGCPNVILTRLSGDGEATNDPYGWSGGARTMPNAHNWIIDHWDELADGDVVDVEYILGETTERKISERMDPANLMKRYQYRTPKDTVIIGSLDVCPCRAEIQFFFEDGLPEYEGGTKMFYDDQRTRQRDGKDLYLDDEGDEWTLDQCTREEIDEDGNLIESKAA